MSGFVRRGVEIGLTTEGYLATRGVGLGADRVDRRHRVTTGVGTYRADIVFAKRSLYALSVGKAARRTLNTLGGNRTNIVGPDDWRRAGLHLKG